MRIFSVLFSKLLSYCTYIWDIIRANGATREMPRTVDGGAYKHRACEVRGVSCVMCILCELYTALYRTLPRILYTDDRTEKPHKHETPRVHGSTVPTGPRIKALIGSCTTASRHEVAGPFR